MVSFSTLPHPDMSTGSNAVVLRTLEHMADEGYSLDRLCAVLRDHMGVVDVVVCYPNSAPPDGFRVAVTPLFAENRHVADLYAILPPNSESISAAAQLAVFAPVMARSAG